MTTPSPDLSTVSEKLERPNSTMPSSRILICHVSDITEGVPLRCEVDGEGALAVYRVDGAFFVTSDVCTHGTASLTEDGDLDGFIIECSWHSGKFDIRTGEAVAAPCYIPLKVYPVQVIDGDVYIDVI